LTKALVVTLAALALFAATGCSGGETEEELTREEFISRADAICVEANAEVANLPSPNLADPAATPSTIREVVEIQRAARRRLAALKPPPEDVPAIREWLRFVDASVDQAERVARALERDERQAVNDANAEGSDARLEADQLARQYGLTRCAAEDPQPTTSTTAPRTRSSRGA
jgi:hypothetical protein